MEKEKQEQERLKLKAQYEKNEKERKRKDEEQRKKEKVRTLQEHKKEQERELQESREEAVREVARAKEQIQDADSAEQSEILKSALEKHIRSHWVVPKNTTGLSAKIKVVVDDGYNVANITVTKSSGDKKFDNSLMAAIKNASPLPLHIVEGTELEGIKSFSMNFTAD